MSEAVGVIRFPGTNCDQDVFSALELVNAKPQWIWHQDQFETLAYNALVVPGGFSYGDYLRCGALAALSPVMKSVVTAAGAGVPVLGICNGFQILCEAGLLPGVLLQNHHLRFADKWVDLSLQNSSSRFFSGKAGSKVRLPIAHGEGRYFVEEDQLDRLFDAEQVWWTYDRNPNGSVENIAGVMNEEKNVAALMPHPERAVKEFMGSVDGLAFFKNLGWGA